MIELKVQGDGPLSATGLEIPVPSVDLQDAREIFSAGRIAQVTLPPSNEGLLAWSLDEWVRRFGKVKINLHRMKPRIAAAIDAKLVESTPEPASASVFSAIQEIQKRASSLVPFVPFGRASIELAGLVERMRAFADTPLEPSWWTDLASAATVRREMTKLEAFGVVNARRLRGLEIDVGRAYEPWSEVFHFVWFGLSGGGMHYDTFDNALYQLKGTKTVLLFDVRLADAVDGEPYPIRIDALHPLGPASARINPLLSHLPYHVVQLRPGEGVTIPARAYHAAFATSFDSISVNSFLVPRVTGRPAAFDRRAQISRMESVVLRASRLCYSALGRGFIKLGPYEFI